METRSPEVFVLDVHTVDHCNFGCPECSECNQASPNTPSKVHNAITYAPLIEKRAEFVRVDYICIVGGESTLHPVTSISLHGCSRFIIFDGSLSLLSSWMDYKQ